MKPAHKCRQLIYELDVALRNLSVNVKVLREKKGYNKTKFCKLLGMSRHRLWSIENNHSNDIFVSTIIRIANLFEIHPWDLFDASESQKDKSQGL